MSKADELWDKHASDTDGVRFLMRQDDFLAALKEYGEHVKAEAVKCVMARYMGDLNREDLEVKRCAAAIEKMELP